MIIGFLYEAPSAETSQTRKWTKMAAAGGLYLSIASLYQKMSRLCYLNVIFHSSQVMMSHFLSHFLWYVSLPLQLQS